MSSPYELNAPTKWAVAPKRFSFSSLATIGSCPRRWQLRRSEWGKAAKFPERSYPATVEGTIVHDGISKLFRALGPRGSPPIGSEVFRAIADDCGFWRHFAEAVDECNAEQALHPRSGPGDFLRTPPRELANRAIQLFRQQYVPGVAKKEGSAPKSRVEAASGADVWSALQNNGALSELTIVHPNLPLTGDLDLVSVDSEGMVTITDFKTGKKKKEQHRSQLLLYSVLWWRKVGSPPNRIKAQYLGESWEEAISPADCAAKEKVVAQEIADAGTALGVQPAPAITSDDCVHCAMRARCAEGWSLVEAGRKLTTQSVDLEATISGLPMPNGFEAKRSDSSGLRVVFTEAVGHSLPKMERGQKFRLLCVYPRETKGDAIEVEIKPWSELYLL